MSKSYLRVNVRVAELAEQPGNVGDTFAVDLPCRPVVGDIINVANLEVDWGSDVGRQLYSRRLNDAGKPAGEALQVTAVVFQPADGEGRSGEAQVNVLAKQCHDPFVAFPVPR